MGGRAVAKEAECPDLHVRYPDGIRGTCCLQLIKRNTEIKDAITICFHLFYTIVDLAHSTFYFCCHLVSPNKDAEK